jgi:lipoate---protein ligase
MEPIRLINLGMIPSWQTQAIYHMLAERMDEDQQDTIVICRPATPYLCLGYHQVFEAIFDPAECSLRGLPVYRRRLGGGATYLDQNQLFYQCIFHHKHMPAMFKDIFAFALAAPVMTLQRLGLNSKLCETNEIEVNGKRIAGTGGGLIGDAAVVVGNLLFDFDDDVMTAVWRTPSPSFRSLAQKALRDHLLRLNTLLKNVSIEAVTDMLIQSFSETMGRPLEQGVLTLEEMNAAKEIAEELGSAETLALHQTKVIPEPIRVLKISARASIRYDETQINGDPVRGSFWLTEDVIKEAVLESVLEQNWASVEQRLQGTLFKEWKEQLN